jgi:hypothetical protein
MDLDVGKIMLVGAIAGGYLWAQRAAALVQQRAARAGEDDALIETARSVGTNSLGAALQGAFVGAIIGLLLMLAYFYFTNPDRGMVIEKVDTGDERY